jgi:Acetyltransferase (GNAT) domain
MNYTIEKNHLSERIALLDSQGLPYHLEITHTFNDDGTLFSTIINLIRDKRNTRVGNANLLFYPPDEMMIADLIVYDEVPCWCLNDRIYKFFNWFEPTNYQRRGLGTSLLNYLIALAKSKGVRKLYGSLTKNDIGNNPNLRNWYKKHGFKIEPPSSNERGIAVHSACLYFD